MLDRALAGSAHVLCACPHDSPVSVFLPLITSEERQNHAFCIYGCKKRVVLMGATCLFRVRLLTNAQMRSVTLLNGTQALFSGTLRAYMGRDSSLCDDKSGDTPDVAFT